MYLEDDILVESSVNESHAYLEIIQNKAFPLEILREAISNAHDYGATKMEITSKVLTIKGKRRLVITIVDDGEGMDIDGLRRFAGLGFSESFGKKQNDSEANVVGEKGHGTLLYFFSEEVIIETKKAGKSYVIKWEKPWEKVSEGEKLRSTPLISECPPNSHGTTIKIIGYGDDDSAPFSHHKMKDYIHWFTKFGAFENQFIDRRNSTLKIIQLQGVDRTDTEMLFMGHPFPRESKNLNNLFDTHLQDAPKYYCRKIIRKGNLPSFPEYEWHAVFSLEGDHIKRDFNPCLGKKKATGLYNVQERYGLWLCKDFIPVMRKNEWIVTKGSEFTRYHAFFNCQAFKLTANRGSIESTDSKIIQDIEKVIRDLKMEIENSEEWENWDHLEGQASGEKTRSREEQDWKRRFDRVKRKKYAEFNGVKLIEPSQENGVFALIIQTARLKPDLYPFEIVDYDTHSGVDLIVRTSDDLNLSKKYDYKYLELKLQLKESFNHCFKYIYGIVCWQISDNVISGQSVADAVGEERYLVTEIDPKTNFTHYYLSNSKSPYRIPVFVLQQYLKERADIQFDKLNKL